ncbi:TRAP transporter large permease subunit [Pelagibius sp. Alg239-R121]|uniref:TRAP transporter large permease n=1 Tax=Pelagibius sp. Alg239-R121 TaxID=2993448 RepID=UPI0024A73EF7|nr:TRAP transporter large permease subunit [Pelagibius sp. Alg239-R121]
MGLSSIGIEAGTWLIFGLAFVILLTGVPLGFATSAVALIFAFGWFGPDAITIVTSRMYGIVTEYSLIAIPMFVLMASLLDRSGLSADMFHGMRIFAGRLRGGVAIQTVIVAFFMAAMSGIIGGETVLLGMLALPQMLKLGYAKDIAIGSVCAGGALGTMIPPSIVLIIYGMITRTSIGDLFIATITPGTILMLSYLIYIGVRCHLRPADGPPLPEAEIETSSHRDALRLVLLPLMLIFLVLGTIYAGIASITEAASLGVAGAAIILAIKRRFTPEVLQKSVDQTFNTCGIIIWAGMGAIAIVGIYNLMGGGRYVTSVFTSLDVAPIIIIIIMMASLFVLGTFMDWIGIAILTLPIFVPIVKAIGYDPIWFGILFSVNMQVAFMTPPLGPSAFFLKSVAPPGISLFDIYRAFIPFVCIQIFVLSLLILFPEISLWPF